MKFEGIKEFKTHLESLSKEKIIEKLNESGVELFSNIVKMTPGSTVLRRQEPPTENQNPPDFKVRQSWQFSYATINNTNFVITNDHKLVELYEFGGRHSKLPDENTTLEATVSDYVINARWKPYLVFPYKGKIIKKKQVIHPYIRPGGMVRSSLPMVEQDFNKRIKELL